MIFECMLNEAIRICEIEIKKGEIATYDGDAPPKLIDRLFQDKIPISLCLSSIYYNIIIAHPYFSMGGSADFISRITCVKANDTTAIMINGRLVAIYHGHSVHYYPLLGTVPVTASVSDWNPNSLAKRFANANAARSTSGLSASP